MKNWELREPLHHGTAGFPLKAYDLAGPSGSVFPCHWHSDWEFVLVERGVVDLRVGATAYPVEPGQVGFIRGGVLHSASSESPSYHCRPVVFNGNLLEGAGTTDSARLWILPLSTGELVFPKIITEDDAVGREIVSLARRLVDWSDHKPPGFETSIQGALLMIVGLMANHGLLVADNRRTAGSGERDFERLKSVLTFLENNIDQPFDLDKVATVACLSRSAFCRFFKSHVGRTPVDYFNLVRTGRAAELLRTTDCSVTEAALEVGFTNFSWFSKTFRRYQGRLPSRANEPALARG